MKTVINKLHSNIKETQTDSRLIVKIALYARYSGKNQSKESANDQINRMRDYLLKGLIDLVKYPKEKYYYVILEEWVIKDESKSAKTAARKGYETIIEGIKEKSFQVILVDDMSRLNRELGNQLHLYDQLKFHGIELYSLCDRMSSESASSKILFTVKGMTSDWSNDDHANRTRRGLESRILKNFSAGDTCYGYKSVPTSTRRTGGYEVPCNFKIEVNQAEATVINLIYDLFLKGFGYCEIAREVTNQGYPSSSRGLKITGKTQNWHPAFIRKILRQPKYIGIWDWGKTKRVRDPDKDKFIKKPIAPNEWLHREANEELRIIDQDKWLKVQAKIAATTNKFHQMKDTGSSIQEARNSSMAEGLNQSTRSRTLLAGVLVCSECGHPMLQVVGTKGGFFGCTNYHRRDRKSCGNKRLLHREKIEARVVGELSRILQDPAIIDHITQTVNTSMKKRLNKSPEEIKQTEKQIIKLTLEIKNLINFISSTGGTISTKDELQNKEQEKFSLEQILRDLKLAQPDKLLITPFVTKSRLQNLLSLLKEDPLNANITLRKLFPGGIKCTSKGHSEKKNLNQYNSYWVIEGELVIDGWKGEVKIG